MGRHWYIQGVRPPSPELPPSAPFYSRAPLCGSWLQAVLRRDKKKHQHQTVQVRPTCPSSPSCDGDSGEPSKEGNGTACSRQVPGSALSNGLAMGSALPVQT